MTGRIVATVPQFGVDFALVGGPVAGVGGLFAQVRKSVPLIGATLAVGCGRLPAVGASVTCIGRALPQVYLSFAGVGAPITPICPYVALTRLGRPFFQVDFPLVGGPVAGVGGLFAQIRELVPLVGATLSVATVGQSIVIAVHDRHRTDKRRLTGESMIDV